MQEPAVKKPEFAVAARWVIPVEPHGVVLEHHAVAVGGGRLLEILPTAELAERHPGLPIIARTSHVLLPGLINAHTHMAMSLFRGMASDLPLAAWLDRHIWPAEQQWVGPEFVRDGTRLAFLEMIRGGTTCCSDMYYFPDVAAGLAVEHHMRIAVGMLVMDRPTPWARTGDEYFAKGLAVHDQYRDHPLVRATFAPHAPYSVGDDNFARIRLLADEVGAPVHMHLHETAGEIRESITAYGERPIARLNRLGLVSSQLIAVHMTHLLPEEIDLVAERRVAVVHCPESNLKLASGMCPVARLGAAGVNVALGTDGPASNNDLDMFGEMRTAALLAKGVAGDAQALPAAAALAAATLNGARALGISEGTGSLVPGKWADMICVDLDEPATQPVHNALAQLVYSVSRDQVTDSWIAGRQVLENRHTTLLDGPDVMARAHAWQTRIRDSV